MSTVHGFELLREERIDEYDTRARLLRHVRTGAELLSLENDDEHKVFGITFRTPPSDSTGLPHILEHSVLCGSRNYPVKEPFVELKKGSLNTFLNAMTFPDKTCYPVASQNLQDFYNLIDVYLDAVFFPLITPEILQQEGWHYELEDPGDPLRFKGVVFNEMKGAYSSPDSLLGRYSQQSLFPDNPYGFDSGGDPRVIPDLTYEQFQAFHETYYHPSNARIFFYGDDDPKGRLRLLDEYLAEFEPLAVPSAVHLQPRLDRPQRFRYPYDADREEDGDQKGMVRVNWLLTEVDDPEAILGLSMLSHILVGSSASPLRKALIDSGLGEDLTGSGADTGLRQGTFATGLKGMDPDDVGAVETLILDTLRELASQGIEPDTVEAAINSIEFSLRENNTGRYPRGLILMLRALRTWLHDGDPIAPLAFEAPLASIKARLEAGETYFETLIRRHLLDNAHRTTVILEPDPELRQRWEAQEAERLARARAEMDEAQLQALIENTRRLKLRQETPDPPEALATIPSLELQDLDPEVKRIPLAVLDDGYKTLYHDLFTNGILYLSLGFNLHALPQELLPYVSLFGQALIKMGTDEQDYVKLLQRIDRQTGGVWPSTFTTATLNDDAPEAAWLFLHGKATVAQVDDLLSILRDVLLTVRLDDRARFKQMVLEAKSRMEARLAPGGHSYVNRRLRALFNPADWAAEQMGGISQLFFLRRLAQEVEQDWPAVLEKLETVRRRLFNRAHTLCNVTLDQENWQAIRPRLSDFMARLPAAPPALTGWSPPPRSGFEGLTIPAQVNYVGKGADLYRLGYRLHGSVAVITHYLRTTWLWDRVRVQGGAYGGLCSFDYRSGVFSYLSYRDPNLLDTLEIYDRTGRFLRELKLEKDELNKSIIGTIGKMDAYQLPDAKGYSSMHRYLSGDDDERRQRRREQVLATTQADFEAFAEVLERVKREGQVVVMGSQEAIQAANGAREGWLDVHKVL